MIPQVEHDWPAVRRDYEANEEPVGTVCRRHKVSSTALYDRREAEGWKLRQPSVSISLRRASGFAGSRETVIHRLYKVLEKQLAAIESRTDAAGCESADECDIETSSAILGLLERLTSLSRPDGAAAARAKPGAKDTDKSAKGSNAAQELSHDDAEHFRRDLAFRIDRLKRGGA